jgi:hypothetical protein
MYCDQTKIKNIYIFNSHRAVFSYRKVALSLTVLDAILSEKRLHPKHKAIGILLTLAIHMVLTFAHLMTASTMYVH